MAPITTSTTPATTPRPAAAKRLSTPMRLPSLPRAPKHTAVLDAEAELVSLWLRPRARRASSSSSTSSTSSSSSTSSATSSGSASSSHAPSSPPTKKSKSRNFRAVDMIISGVSSLLIMPMPFLKRGSPQPPPPPSATGATDPVLPRKRRFSLPSLPGLPGLPARPTRPTHRKRNSLVLPEVPMPEEPASPSPSARTSSCTPRESCSRTRPTPPPLEDRIVRFILPPPKFAPPIDWPGDEEPAWSDFIRRRTGDDAERDDSERGENERDDSERAEHERGEFVIYV
ncbi:hypothetical protein DFH09DRAFT_1283513 [Mycena vulgaris]|nr:hypothetical protein DFH09DRAFT_1283513 [Mycena vulgaris]